MKPTRIAIIGAGVAGIATALFLRRGVSAEVGINIYEAAACTENRIGETIPPAASTVLRKLWGAQFAAMMARHLECPGSLSLWNSNMPGYNEFLFQLDGNGYHLDRACFDTQLRDSTLNQNIQWHWGHKLKRVQSNHSGYQLNFSLDKAQIRLVPADFVVDASGQSRAFCRRIGVARNVLDAVLFTALSAPIDVHHAMPRHTLVEAVAQGWWYAARLPKNKMILGFCADKIQNQTAPITNASELLQALSQTQWLCRQLPLEQLQHLAASLDIQHYLGSSSLLSKVTGPDWLAVGDAACSYDPISSAGITKALQHAERAAQCLSKTIATPASAPSPMEDYEASVFADFREYAALRHQLYASETRFQDAGFWRRRLGRMDCFGPNIRSPKIATSRVPAAASAAPLDSSEFDDAGIDSKLIPVDSRSLKGPD